MLRDGPYPLYLQQRVRSNKGHLANEDAGRFLKKMANGKLRHVVLAHLSETNNLPELALLSATGSIGACTKHIRIIPAAQSVPSPVIDLSDVDTDPLNI
jgi:phosphoribosyl 1,2-cyclic phosphodiesterase